MNVSVKHNGSTITSYTISYSREHRICTGVGTLEIILDGTYSTSISPHDHIDIYENGSFQVRYYVSDIAHNVPDGTITLQCQDKSKYLVDYFIPDSYTIDYPSYTRYWIEKFLTEAQISYSFNTTSQGNLLSNYTALGLQSAYDQIMMLLQLSGWYMYFDGNGVAVIGTLDTDLASTAGSLGLTDIIDIKRVTDDKMLRNRAVVWGQFDPIRQEYAYADISKKTPWNYDSRDLRAMVISNSNIPNKSSAYNIANILLKEFARATIEKHIVATEARNFNLGDAIRVNSHVWRGKGLITTFGVSMDKGGLVTNIVLDERCPRLFGYFNFGDYVYVGTFGDGVWRKHIQFDPTWYNFSTGLTDLNITDLHINSGIFGSVGHSGALYYANDEAGSWHPITVSSFDSSMEDTVPSGGTVTYQPFSGLMARAVIVDKEVNTVKFGIDTWSGLNTGDYFLTYSGIGSGVMESGTMRGWIVEYDPFTGQPVGGLGSGIYPIVYSGSYSFMVLDLENDGLNDYVSVATSGSTLVPVGGFYDFGFQNTQPFASTKDSSNYSITPMDTSYVNDNNINNSTFMPVSNKFSLVSIDNTAANERMVMSISKGRVATKCTFTKVFDEGLGNYVINEDFITSAACPSISSNDTILGIYPEWFYNTFTVFFRINNSSSADVFKYVVWDANANTWSSATTLGTQSLSLPNGMDGSFTESIVIGNIIYNLRYYVSAPNTSGGFYTSASEMNVYIEKIGMEFRTYQEDHLYQVITEEYEAGHYEYFPALGYSASESAPNLGRLLFAIYQKNDGVQILGHFEIAHFLIAPHRFREYIVYGNDTVLQTTNVYDDTTARLTNARINRGSQLDINHAFIGKSSIVNGQTSLKFNGSTLYVYTGTGSVPFYEDLTKIYPILGDDDRYLALSGSTWYICDSNTINTIDTVTSPTDRSIAFPYTSPLEFLGNEVYFTATNNVESYRELIPYRPATNTFDLPRLIHFNSIPTGTGRRFNYGDLFIADADDYTISNPQAFVAYVDMGTPRFGGGSYLVLQREGSEFNLIQRASKPLRIDISNNSPVLTVQDFENTFVSNFIYGLSLEQVIPISGLLAQEVRDYRYTLLETLSGTIVSSGTGAEEQIVYVYQSGIYYANAETYSGGFTLFDSIPSGFAERIETTNFVYPGQFLFVTTSGDNPMFYQKDNDAFFFTAYSGLPDSRATIIRCDDRM